MSVITVVRRLHRWAGLVAGAVIAIVSFSGAVLVYGGEIERALEPELWSLSGGSEAPLPVSAWLGIMAERYPERSVRSLRFESDPRRPVTVEMGPDLRIFLHPRSGEIIAERDPARTFYAVMEALHQGLLAGEIGNTIVAVCTVLLLIVIPLGLWLWWPRNRFKLGSSFWIDLRRGWKRAVYDLHNVLGFYSALALFLLAATGIMMAYPGLTRNLGRVVFPQAGEPGEAGETDASTNAAGQGDEARAARGAASPAGSVVDAAVAHAEAGYPGAWSTTIRFPPPRGGPLRILKAMSAPSGSPELHTFTYEANTGDFLTLTRHSDASMARKASRLVGGIHLGTVYGWPTRLIAFLVSLIAGMLPITGALVWYPRWRRKRQRKKASARLASGRHP